MPRPSAAPRATPEGLAALATALLIDIALGNLIGVVAAEIRAHVKAR